MPPASEALFFDNEPVAHIVAWQQVRLEQRRQRLQREALRIRPPMYGPSRFAALESYWRNPAPFEAERAAGQASINALFAGHEARVRAEQEARWAREGDA